MSIKEDRLRDVISKVAHKCGMKNWRFKTEEIRETYFGVLIPLTVIGDLNGTETFQRLYVKLPTEDEPLRECSDYMWDTEVYVYGTFVPLWKRVLNVDVDELIPQCYHADATPNKQILVLKNMRYAGFQNYNERFLDYDHIVASLKSLAQFHALSFIIKKEHKDLTTTFLRPYTDEFPMKLNVAMLNCFRRHSQLFKGSKYEFFWEETLGNFKTVANSTIESKCLLYGHGDFWKENIMFKYEANKPIKACLLDFQTCRLMTPAYDFLYFILNSTDGSLRRLHYYNFLTEYYEIFRNVLLGNGIQLELLYSREDFISELKAVASLCIMRVCLAFSLWLGFEVDALVKSKNSRDEDENEQKDEEDFKRILIDSMEDLCNYGYITL